MANVLKPEVLWIEGRCYRVNDPSTEVSALQEHDLYENDYSYNDNEETSDEEDKFEVTMSGDSRYSTSFHVSKHYSGYIIGKKGATKMRIERETKTSIRIPKQTETGDINILGSSAASVKAARRRINTIVISSRSKQRPTHFISIPVNNTDIMRNFENFKERVLKETPSRGLEESIFMRTQRLHLTIGVMCLMDNEERLEASKLLGNAKEKIIMFAPYKENDKVPPTGPALAEVGSQRPLLRQYAPLRLRVKGLSYMNDDPKQINVLYANVHEERGETGVLQTMTDQLVDYFYKAGYMDRSHNRDHVKLHVTVINSKYRVSEDARSQRESFDGSDILKKFADFDFGVAELNQIHLSQRNTTGEDGYYQPTCIVSCGQ